MNCHGCLAHFVLHSTVFFHFLGLVLSWKITSALSLRFCHLSFDKTQVVLSCKNHLSFFGASDTASLFFGYFWICGSIWKFSPAIPGPHPFSCHVSCQLVRLFITTDESVYVETQIFFICKRNNQV